jgi:hypothetical protein
MNHKQSKSKTIACLVFLGLSISGLAYESQANTMIMRKSGNALRARQQISANGIEDNTTTSENMFMNAGQKQFIKIGIGVVDQDGDILNAQKVWELEPGTDTPNGIDTSNIKEIVFVENNNISKEEEQEQDSSISGMVSLVEWSLDYNVSSNEKSTRTIKGGFSDSGYVETFSEGQDGDYQF